MRAIRPYIITQTNPQTIEKGQSLIISARFYNRDTNLKMPVRNIYLNIISLKDGHTIWPVEVVRKDDWKMDIEIGSKDMKEGHSYLVRVSNNRNLSPEGSTEFKVIKPSGTPLILFPLIPMPSPEDDVSKKLILKKIFRTQMDARVCPLCLEAQAGNSPGLPSSEYYPDDPDVPKIPLHFNCRCTYDIIFNDGFEASFEEIKQIYQAAKVAKILKILPYIEAIS